jgi:hypothetical protein
MSLIPEENYSPLNKTLLSVFNAYKREGYCALFVFRNGWGDLLYAAVKPQTPPWEAFAHAAAEHNAHQPLIAFDLRQDYADQMPAHFLESLETLDAFAYSPLIYIPDRHGVIPAEAKQRVIDELSRPVLVAHTNETPKRSPRSGKLRLV